MSKKIGVLLSGCGVYDGSEIHEAVLTLLAISKNGAEAICMAPNIDQTDVINHLTGEKVDEKRNALVEAARIARGKIKDVAEVDVSELDAVILPGGFGAAKTLSSYAQQQDLCQVNPAVARLLKDCIKTKKPIGAICIAPVVVAKLASSQKPVLTIGTDKTTKDHLEKMGAQHQECSVHEIAIDKTNLIVSTPAYMLAQNITEAAEGIEKLVKEIVGMVQ